jgi:uridine kinase
MNNVIRKDYPQQTVEIHLPNKQVLSGLRGTPIGVFLREIEDESKSPIVGAIINDSLRELTYPVELESEVIPITMSDGDGARIYRRSVTFLMVTAFKELFPKAGLIVDHSVASGGFYCEITNRGPLTQEELYNLDATMRDMVAQDLLFEKKVVPIEKAIEYFQSQNLTEKVRLLKYRTKDTLVLYTLKKHSDYHHGYMVPSTGYLKWFTLNPFGEGFVLQYPRRSSPKILLPMPGYPQLLKTFRQYGDWLERLGIDNVGALNDAIHSGRAKELILVSEALHEQKIAEIARKIADRSSKSRIILIAGPSSSGKTTFSKRLAIQLLALGLSPFALEMDNYFVDREKTPLDYEGKPNFEAFETLDTNLLGDQVAHLLAGDEVQMPHFNFKTGKSEKGDLVKLQKDQLVILEGIHGLNPRLLPNISPERTFKIYISCLTQLNLDRHNRISTTDTRLLRRIVRDSATRGYNAAQTMQRWESVRKGEKEHIFPYQEDADDLFNSALVYELSALRPLAEPILRQVQFGSLEYIEAKRLLALLEWFLELPGGLIPDNSILREFIGGSILSDFVVWKNHEQL